MLVEKESGPVSTLMLSNAGLHVSVQGLQSLHVQEGVERAIARIMNPRINSHINGVDGRAQLSLYKQAHSAGAEAKLTSGTGIRSLKASVKMPSTLMLKASPSHASVP